MKTSQRGFTIIEMFVVLLLLAVFALVIQSKSCSDINGSKETAEENLRAYTTEMRWEVVAFSCAGSDSDQDGYISCTVDVATGGEGIETKALECASGAGCVNTQGCKLATAKMVQ